MYHSYIITLFLTLCALFVTQLSWAQQLQTQVSAPVAPNNGLPAAGGAAAGSAAASSSSSPGLSDELKRFEDYKKSPLFVEPFDPKVLSLPDAHLKFVREVTKSDFVFFKTILNESISMRNKYASSVRLMLKYSGKLMSTFIKNRRDERKLPNRVEPKPDFYLMLADLSQAVMDQSAIMKRKYSKDSIDIESFRSRVETLFDAIEQTIDTAPMGAYLKWNQMVLYKDFLRNGIQNRSFTEEAADLVGQFRAMGYESTTFVIRRIINLLRVFSRGSVPSSEKEV